MVRYRWTQNGFVDAEGNRMVDPSQPFTPSHPMVIRDLEPYQSPVTGKMITSRSQQREDLKASGCRIVEPDESPTKGAIRNKKFAAKRGLTVSDNFRDYDSSSKEETV